MTQTPPYDRTLRAIGQALEAKRLNVVNLKSASGNFLVRGEPEKGGKLQALLRKWQDRRADHKGPYKFNYTLEDVDRLEREGRAKRHNPHRLPDFHSLSNVLRIVGAYLDMKGAQLLEFNKRDLTLMILYRTKEGHPEVEERPIASFYGLFLELYHKRDKGN